MRSVGIRGVACVVVLAMGGVAGCEDLPTEPGSTAELAGAWTTVADGAHIVLAFTGDGTYWHVEDGTDDESGFDGLERGSYSWSRSTGAFSSTCPESDTNGQWGLSHGTEESQCSGTPASLGILALVNATTAAFGAEGDEPFVATRIADADRAIVGGWTTELDGNHIFVALLSNGTYVHAEVGTASEGGQTGIERGTYSWDPATGAFATGCPAVDTNGQWGLSHPTPELGCTGMTSDLGATVAVENGDLVFRVGEEQPLAFTRVGG